MASVLRRTHVLHSPRTSSQPHSRKASSFSIEALVGRARTPSPPPQPPADSRSPSPDLDPTGYDSDPDSRPPYPRGESPEAGEILPSPVRRGIGSGASSSFHPVLPGSSAALLTSLRLSAAGLPPLPLPGDFPHFPGQRDGLPPGPPTPHSLPLHPHGGHPLAGLPPPVLVGGPREPLALYPWLMSRQGNGLPPHRFGGQ